MRKFGILIALTVLMGLTFAIKADAGLFRRGRCGLFGRIFHRSSSGYGAANVSAGGCATCR